MTKRGRKTRPYNIKGSKSLKRYYMKKYENEVTKKLDENLGTLEDGHKTSLMRERLKMVGYMALWNIITDDSIQYKQAIKIHYALIKLRDMWLTKGFEDKRNFDAIGRQASGGKYEREGSNLHRDRAPTHEY